MTTIYRIFHGFFKNIKPPKKLQKLRRLLDVLFHSSEAVLGLSIYTGQSFFLTFLLRMCLWAPRGKTLPLVMIWGCWLVRNAYLGGMG